MKIIKVKNEEIIKELNLTPNVMTAGFFDGMHLGHQFLIKEAKKKAKQFSMPLVVLTFWPYPKQFYTNVPQPYPILSTLADKEKQFNRLGVDIVLEVNFNNRIQNMAPQDFVDFYLKAAHVKHFIAGIDFTYGKKAIANMECLANYAQNAFTITKVPFTKIGNKKISSSLVRHAINNHELEIVEQLLGRPYITKGTVIKGEKIGRTLNFPTANSNNLNNYLMPPAGVYFTCVKLKGKVYWGITSLGNKPTYNGKKQFLETFILDFSDNIYGEKLSIAWLHFERYQMKFKSEKDLKNKISQDEVNIRRYIANNDWSLYSYSFL